MRRSGEPAAVPEHTVLLVEDNPVVAHLTVTQLKAFGYDVVVASSVAEAQGKLEGWQPALCLLDIDLPDGSGLALCREIKESSAGKQIPVIMLTHHEDPAVLVKAFNAGAVDYVRRPFLKEELIARIELQLRVASLLAELGDRNRKLRDDLELAARVQRSLVARSDESAVGFTTAVRFRPTATLAGDMCGQVVVDNEHSAFFLLDVSGHGTGAALVAVAVAGLLTRLLAEQSFVPRTLEQDLQQLLSLENTALYGTLALAILNRRTGSLRIYNYGHLPVIITRKDEVFVFEATAPPLGVGFSESSPVEVDRVQLHRGDRLLLFSDGVTDATSSVFNQQLKVVQQLMQSSAPIHQVADQLVELEADAERRAGDDATLLLLEFQGAPRGKRASWRPRVVHRYELPSLLTQMAPWWQAVEAILVDLGWGPPDSKLLMNVGLAAYEGVTNAIKHGHAEDGRPLHIELWMADNAFEIHVLDSGPGFDLAQQIELPSVLAESGRGLFLMQSLVTEMRYERSPRENVLVLRQERPRGETQP